MSRRLREYYEANPLMVSSPFGGVDGIDSDLLDSVLERLGIALAGRSILDVGCGRAYLRDFVRQRGGGYVGVDLGTPKGGGPDASADSHRLPFGDAAFDGVFCVDAFEHFAYMARAATEFRRVLRPGGFVFLSVPNYANPAGLVKKVLETCGIYDKNTWAPFRHWQPQELEQFLTAGRVRRIWRAAGFRNQRRIAYAEEVGLGLCPWMAHPSMPEAVMFRLQRLFGRLGPSVAAVWPGASLHGFWKIE